jgi:Zn-dependent alcohol dehydrogenase
VCHSDLHFMQGHFRTRLPAVLGHEAARIGLNEVNAAFGRMRAGEVTRSVITFG